MSDRDLHRAAEARHLLDHPLLKELLAEIEKRAIEDMILVRGAEPEDDRKRRGFLEQVHAIRDLRNKLDDTIRKANRPVRFRAS